MRVMVRVMGEGHGGVSEGDGDDEGLVLWVGCAVARMPDLNVEG